MQYNLYIESLKKIINCSIREENFYSLQELYEKLEADTKISKYKSLNVIENILSGMSIYQRDYTKNIYAKAYIIKPLKNGEYEYKFMRGATQFLKWIDNGFENMKTAIIDNTMYLLGDSSSKGFKEKLMILGLLVTLEVLNFKALGGKNSQLYIYVNQTKTMREIIEKPWRYTNRLLELVGERHEISVEMLTFIFEEKSDNETMWKYIEEYFLGIIPHKVIERYQEKIRTKKTYWRN